MSISILQYDGSSIAPKDDARLYNYLLGKSGVVEGCTVTSLGANQLQIAAGWGVIAGRMFVIAQETVNATVSDSGTKKGRLIIAIDIENTETPIAFDTQMATTLPDLTQEDINDDGTVYEFALAEYDISEIAVSNLESVATVLLSHDSANNISIADAGSKYTATDVEGALQELPKPDRTIYGTAADGATSGAIDPNTITKSGFYYVLSHANCPGGSGGGHIVHAHLTADGGYSMQLFMSSGNAEFFYIRHCSSGTWGSWRRIYNESNLSIVGTDAAAPALSVKGAVGQSGDIFAVKDSSNNPILEVTSNHVQALGQFFIDGEWQKPLNMGGKCLWVDASNKLRIKGGTPSSDTDGTVVGTQT